jgi:hypothetical protein
MLETLREQLNSAVFAYRAEMQTLRETFAVKCEAYEREVTKLRTELADTVVTQARTEASIDEMRVDICQAAIDRGILDLPQWETARRVFEKANKPFKFAREKSGGDPDPDPMMPVPVPPKKADS